MQSEAITMLAEPIFGNDAAVAFAGSQRNLELKIFEPVIIHNDLDSVGLLADACRSFTDHCVAGMELGTERTEQNVKKSLMLVTALGPKIGYDTARGIAHWAHHERLGLREAALKLGYLARGEVDAWKRWRTPKETCAFGTR